MYARLCIHRLHLDGLRLSIILYLRDWSLITGRGGGYKMGKSRVRNCLRPLPRVKLFAPPPPYKEYSLFASLPPSFNMAKTSSYSIKTTPKLFVPPPFCMAETFPAPPPPFHRGKTSRAPSPLPFCRLSPIEYLIQHGIIYHCGPRPINYVSNNQNNHILCLRVL